MPVRPGAAFCGLCCRSRESHAENRAGDQALVRHGIRALLERLGGIEVVIEADSGESLFEALLGQPVDAALADTRMPRRSGVDALTMLRQRGDPVPVILIGRGVALNQKP